jgi:hypothetical protein
MKAVLNTLKHWLVFWIGALLAMIIGVFAYDYVQLENVVSWQPLTASWFNQLLENVGYLKSKNDELNEKINTLSWKLAESDVFVAYDAEWVDWPNLWLPDWWWKGSIIQIGNSKENYKWWRVWIYVNTDGSNSVTKALIMSNWAKIAWHSSNNVIIWDPVWNLPNTWNWFTSQLAAASFNIIMSSTGSVQIYQLWNIRMESGTNIITNLWTNIADTRIYRVEFTNNPK